jgi:hypothetical protein
MDINNSISYNELRDYHNKHFSLSTLNVSITEKFALISLICYITKKLQAKVPDITYYKVIYKLSEGHIPENFIKGLAIICEDFAYHCDDFPTFDLQDKQIPNKIKEILVNWLPF